MPEEAYLRRHSTLARLAIVWRIEVLISGQDFPVSPTKPSQNIGKERAGFL
jgi:hypothetical protein